MIVISACLLQILDTDSVNERETYAFVKVGFDHMKLNYAKVKQHRQFKICTDFRLRRIVLTRGTSEVLGKIQGRVSKFQRHDF